MDIRVLPDANAVAIAAADIIEHALSSSRPVIGLAAGVTPLAAYAELTRRHREAGLRFDHAEFVLLDEYLGLPDADPNRFLAVVRAAFTDRVGVPASQVHAPADHQAGTERYERLLSQLGRRDVQLLGIGRNGHIGFNEPGTPHHVRTHVVELHESTRAANADAFAPDRVPTQAVTMGIATILDADRLLLLAIGATKAHAVAAALEGPISTSVPASAIQGHADVTVLLDAAAASELAG